MRKVSLTIVAVGNQSLLYMLCICLQHENRMPSIILLSVAEKQQAFWKYVNEFEMCFDFSTNFF